MPIVQNRRQFLATLSWAGTAGLLRAPVSRAAEGALETTTVRLGKGSLCGAPAYLAEELLRAEGFTDVGYPEMPPSTADTAYAVGRGYVDITQGYASQFIPAIEAGE